MKPCADVAERMVSEREQIASRFRSERARRLPRSWKKSVICKKLNQGLQIGTEIYGGGCRASAIYLKLTPESSGL